MLTLPSCSTVTAAMRKPPHVVLAAASGTLEASYRTPTAPKIW